MHKNDLVTLSQKSIESLSATRNRPAYAWRRTTVDEKNAWYASDESRGMTDDGETKLAPLDAAVDLVPGQIYVVVKGRTQAPHGYGSISGCMTLLDTTTGVIFFSKKENFQNVK